MGPRGPRHPVSSTDRPNMDSVVLWAAGFRVRNVRHAGGRSSPPSTAPVRHSKRGVCPSIPVTLSLLASEVLYTRLAQT